MIDINYLSVKQHPNTVEKWGADKSADINRLLDNGVDLVINSTDETLLYAGLSETFSVWPDKPVVFIDCQGHNRYYVSEEDIENKKLPKPKVWNLKK